MKTPDPLLETVSATAWGVAERRARTDIPYAKDIYGILDARILHATPSDELGTLTKFRFDHLTPYFEARFKMINLILKEHKPEQILELAAGYSPRGIALAWEHPDLTYIEMDLLTVAREKWQTIDTLSIIKERRTPSNLFLEDGDVTRADDFTRVTRWLRPGPVTVVSEGLMRYLPKTRQLDVARNVRDLLAERGGTWITPDITARGMMATGPLKQIVREQNHRLREITGLDVRENYFANEEEARTFYENRGFTIERRSFNEVRDILVSPKEENIPAAEVDDALGTCAVYVMRGYE
jgi:O-methyltransferase involved in polyketide biosynthesis